MTRTEAPPPAPTTIDGRTAIRHCDYCGTECKGGQGKASHERKCPENPANKPSPAEQVLEHVAEVQGVELMTPDVGFIHCPGPLLSPTLHPVDEVAPCDLPCNVDPCDHTDCTRDDDTFEIRSCRVCGCTDEEACEDGCYWVEDPEGLGDLCSTCLPKVLDVPCDAPCDRVRELVETPRLSPVDEARRDAVPLDGRRKGKSLQVNIEVSGLGQVKELLFIKDEMIDVLADRVLELESHRGFASHLLHGDAPYVLTTDAIREFAASAVKIRKRARLMSAFERIADALVEDGGDLS